MSQDEPASRPHVRRMHSIEADRQALARLIDEGNASDAETEYYEAFSDPDVRAQDREKRRRAGQYLRRVRRLASPDKGPRPED